MRHKRSSEREGWTHKGYKYWAKPMQDLPIYAHEQARLMQEMWNRCVQFFNEETEKRNDFCRENEPSVSSMEDLYNNLCNNIDKRYQEFNFAKIKYCRLNNDSGKAFLQRIESDIKKMKKERSAIRKEIRVTRNNTAKKFKYKPEISLISFLNNLEKTYIGYGLSYHYAEAKKISFKNTIDNFFKGNCKPPRHKKHPSLSFSIREHNKGCKFEQKTKRSTTKTMFWIDPTGHKGRTNFYWKFGDDVVTFRTIIHRPIPDDAFIKSVKISQDKVTKKWSIIFSIEMPPVELPHGDKIFYFIPRWSVDHFQDDLIAGELNIFSQEGNNKSSIVRLFKENEFDFNADKSKKFILTLIKAVEENRSLADKAIEEMKDEIEPLLLKLKCFDWNGNLSLCRIRGIKEIQKIFNEKIPCHPINSILLDGISKYYYYINHSNGIDKRIRRFRDWCYWNFAKKIAEQAKEIYLEKIDLEELGKIKDLSSSKQEIESVIRKQKSYAAHYSLYDKIKKKCAEHGVTVKEGEFRKESLYAAVS